MLTNETQVLLSRFIVHDIIINVYRTCNINIQLEKTGRVFHKYMCLNNELLNYIFLLPPQIGATESSEENIICMVASVLQTSL